MPEGDTIHRSARRLAERLQGATLIGLRTRKLAGARPRAGESIVAVEAVGKHLVIAFSGGLSLETHLGMTGTWHLYRTDERWQQPEHLASVVIEVDGWTAVCFRAPTVRTFARASATTPLDHLGVDLCRSGADLSAAVARMARCDPSTEIADVLLDQRVVSGIGNVYKSETLFACRVDPFIALRELDDRRRRELVEAAARLLQSNLDRPHRATTGGGGLAVYGRARRPCVVCGTAIASRPQGPHRRLTYYCPRCQASVAG